MIGLVRQNSAMLMFWQSRVLRGKERDSFIKGLGSRRPQHSGASWWRMQAVGLRQHNSGPCGRVRLDACAFPRAEKRTRPAAWGGSSPELAANHRKLAVDAVPDEHTAQKGRSDSV
jgi:hypothetical protein